jgi:uncharacterized protein YlxW (UPF0749 family)
MHYSAGAEAGVFRAFDNRICFGGIALKKALRKKSPEFITFKIVRGTTQNTRSIRLPKTVIKTIAGLMAIYLVFVVVMTYRTGTLSFTYQRRLDDIKELEAINETQQQEINTLNEITAEVREKLQSLESIENKVKELVGID